MPKWIKSDQKIKSGTGYKMVRFKDPAFTKTGIMGSVHSAVKKHCRQQCGSTWGISRVSGEYNGKTRKYEHYFYVAFTDDQDMMVARLKYEGMHMRSMWHTNTKFMIFGYD